MTENILHIIKRVSLTLITVSLLLPSIVKFSHILENHEHTVCIEEHQKHFHEIDLDCEFFKFKLNNNLLVSPEPIIVYEAFQQQFLPKEHYIFLIGHQQNTAYLRGPPQNI